MFPPGSGIPQSTQGMAAGMVRPVTPSLLQGIDRSSAPTGYVMPHGVGAAMTMNPPVSPGPMQAGSWMQPNQQVGGVSAKMWHSQPQPTQSHQRHQQSEVKHREYLKQQQRLKAMAFSSSKGVSADALIGNLLEKKDTFKPKLNHQPAPLPPVQTSSAPQHMTTSQMQSGRPTAPGAVVGPVQLSDDLPGWLTPGSSRLPPLYAHIWSLVSDSSLDGALVDTNKILALLLTSSLPKEVLGFIWNLATNGTNGQLNQQQLYITLALVAMAQNGCTFNNLNVLNLVPQPPIPTFNMNVPKSASENKMRRSDLNLQPSQPPISAPHLSSSLTGASSLVTLPSAMTPIQNSIENGDDFGDEFSDFQSAEIIDAPALSSVPSSLPSTTIVQPVITAKQVVNDLNQSVVAKLGRNHGRSIGSRLANHTLGAPKTRSHNHRHRRASADRDNLYMDAEVTFGLEKSHGLSESLSWKNSDKQHTQHDNSENEDFNDFQVAAGLNVNVDELFPRCNPKGKKVNMVLKESAIRNDFEDEEQKQSRTEVELLSLDSPPPSTPCTTLSTVLPVISPPVVSSVAPVTASPLIVSAALPVLTPPLTSNISSAANAITPPVLPPPTTVKTTKDFMGVEEDRYSALRFIELDSQSSKNSNDTEALADDFGDFVSADDSFEEIASREQASVTKESIPALDVGWQTPAMQSVEFPIDDWGSKDLFDISSGLPKQSVVSAESKLSPDSLSSEFMNLDISSAGRADTAPNFINSTPSWTFDLVPGKDTPELDIKPVLNESEANHDDEFGDFVGPQSTWVDDSSTNSAVTAAGVLGDCGWTDTAGGKVAPGLFCDNRSVSSLELPGGTLSRHGSLPSLDLKLFSNNDDNSQVGDWIRCLDSCSSLLQAACNTFRSISSNEVVMEVLSTSEGRSYFINLLEVQSVSWRIQRSYQQAGHESNQLDSLLASIEKSWSLLQPFYKLANIDMGGGKNMSDEENGHPVCGVCGSPANSSVIEYGGHSYHAPCANLWLNCVNRTLPAHSPLL